MLRGQQALDHKGMTSSASAPSLCTCIQTLRPSRRLAPLGLLVTVALAMLASAALGTAGAQAAQHSQYAAHVHRVTRTSAARRHHNRARRVLQRAQHASSRPTTGRPRTAAQKQAATIAAVLAKPCENTQLTPEAGNLALISGSVLCLINLERARHGETPLVPRPILERAADAHAQELVADDYFAHVSPNGVT